MGAALRRTHEGGGGSGRKLPPGTAELRRTCYAPAYHDLHAGRAQEGTDQPPQTLEVQLLMLGASGTTTKTRAIAVALPAPVLLAIVQSLPLRDVFRVAAVSRAIAWASRTAIEGLHRELVQRRLSALAALTGEEEGVTPALVEYQWGSVSHGLPSPLHPLVDGSGEGQAAVGAAASDANDDNNTSPRQTDPHQPEASCSVCSMRRQCWDEVAARRESCAWTPSSLLKAAVPVQLKGHFGKVMTVSVPHAEGASSALPMAVSGAGDGSLKLWDIDRLDAKREKKRRNRCKGTIRLRSCHVLSAALHNSGTLVACGGLDNVVSVFRLHKDPDSPFPLVPDSNGGAGRPEIELVAHQGYVSSVVFHSEYHDSFILSASGDGTAMAWDLNSPQTPVRTFGANEIQGDVCSVAPCGADAAMIAAGAVDCEVSVFDLRSIPRVCHLAGHEGDVNSVRWGRTHFRLVSGSDDGTVRVWDLRHTRAALRRLTYPKMGLAGCTSVAMTPGGGFVVAAYDDGFVRSWAVETGAQQFVLSPNRPENPQARTTSVAILEGANGTTNDRDGALTLVAGSFDFGVYATPLALRKRM